MTPSPELRARTLAAARSEPSLPRSAVRQRTVATFATAALAVIALFVSVGGPDLVSRPRTYLVCSVMGWMGVAVLATWAAVGRGGSMLGRPRALLVALALAVVPSLVAWALMTQAIWSDLQGPTEHFADHCACFAVTLAFAVAGFAGLALVRRGTDPVHPRALGAALGACSGAWASVLIDVHCPLTSTVHILGGHVLPIVALTAIGALVGRRIFGLS
jgi:hypothetical protein